MQSLLHRSNIVYRAYSPILAYSGYLVIRSNPSPPVCRAIWYTCSHQEDIAANAKCEKMHQSPYILRFSIYSTVPAFRDGYTGWTSAYTAFGVVEPRFKCDIA